MKLKRFLPLVLAFVIVVVPTVFAQSRIDEVEGKSRPDLNRSRGVNILKRVKETLKTYYYDKDFHGIDIDAKFKEAAEKIKTLETNSQIFRVIAALLLELDDSHTSFFPPGRSNRVEYGFSVQMIGRDCFIVSVKKGSDAEKQGINIGDIVTRIGQYSVTRDTIWVLNYYIYQLEPMPILPMTIVGPDKKERSVAIQASFKTFEERQRAAEARRKEKHENPYKCVKISSVVTACKLRTFSVEKKYIEQMMRESLGGSKLILDLRGNRGGHVRIEEYLTGHFFDREIKISEMVFRDKTKTSIAKPVKDRYFSGEMVVLIDSDSASASEVFARTMQIQKRAKVVGDVSAGAVMTSYGIGLAINRGTEGFQTFTPFGMNVTIADLIMSDGNRLEHRGVIPDYLVGPSVLALKQKNDPVLSFAAKLLGAAISSEDAGKLEFLFRKAEDEDDEKSDDKDQRLRF